MIDFFKKMFTKSEQTVNIIQKKFDEKATRELLFEENIDKVDFFDITKKEIILKHLKNEINLNKTNNFISKEELEKLGIDKKQKITKELLEVFNLQKIKGKDPKKLMNIIYRNAQNRACIMGNIERVKSLIGPYVEVKVYLLSCKDERTCEWCLSMDNKEIDILKVDIIKLIDDNCTCEYNRSTLMSKLNLEKL